MEAKNEGVVYQPDEVLRLEVKEKFLKFPPCGRRGGLINYFAMGQQLRTRAKRARRKAQEKRAHAKQLAAKKAK